MAIIAQFDTDPVLIIIRNKHHAWHTPPGPGNPNGGAHGFPFRSVREGLPGSGTEFFRFHAQLINEFFAWNNIHHAASPGDIAAWNAIPDELKVPETGWPSPQPGVDLVDAEVKINANPGTFATEDAFGIHMEGTIHDWIHGALAVSPDFALPQAEAAIIASFHSVQCTWFYKIHGLVQYWRQRWLSQHP